MLKSVFSYNETLVGSGGSYETLGRLVSIWAYSWKMPVLILIDNGIETYEHFQFFSFG